MMPLGYMAKSISACPSDWLNAPGVVDIYSVSNCISKNFCDYVNHWKHNGFWFFNAPEDIRAIATAERIDLSGTKMLYYQGYEKQYDAVTRNWLAFGPVPDFPTHVVPPNNVECLGFDLVTYSSQCLPECSPLSCNGIASEVAVNEHCLLNSLKEAIHLLEAGVFDMSEPGPFRVISVSRLVP